MLRFLTGLERLRRRPPINLPASVPAGMRVYAFGDVHGRADLLGRLFSAIKRDGRSSPADRSVIVGLGDYVDRGPDARATIEMLIQGLAGHELVLVRGNHEQMLLDFLDEPRQAGRRWLINSAIDTLRSYAIDIEGPVGRSGPALTAIRDAFLERLPLSHLLFLQELPILHVIGDYVFVHAGVRAGVALDQQLARDMLWLRAKAEQEDRPFEKVVIHGHTPVNRPFLGQYRINLDTGAFLTDRLSCVVLEATMRRVLDF